MRKQTSLLLAVVTLAGVAGLVVPLSADIVRFRAFIYPDKANPERTLVVDDFRVNETNYDIGGVTYLWLHGPDGALKVPFNTISQIEVLKYLGIVDGDVARYEVKVSGLGGGESYTGEVELRVMRGQAFGVPWYSYLAMRPDRGRNFWRFVIGAESMPPTTPPETVAEAAPVVPPPPPVALPAVPPEPPRALTDEEIFASMSLDELNQKQPLSDIFFDFDRSNIRADQQAAVQQDVAWLIRFPTTRIRIEGHADPRGTHEYNFRLGQRRADTVRGALVAAGVPANRIEVVSLNGTALFCSESTEECWAQNRRAHFLFTAK